MYLEDLLLSEQFVHQCEQCVPHSSNSGMVWLGSQCPEVVGADPETGVFGIALEHGLDKSFSFSRRVYFPKRSSIFPQNPKVSIPQFVSV